MVRDATWAHLAVVDDVYGGQVGHLTHGVVRLPGLSRVRRDGGSVAGITVHYRRGDGPTGRQGLIRLHRQRDVGMHPGLVWGRLPRQVLFTGERAVSVAGRVFDGVRADVGGGRAGLAFQLVDLVLRPVLGAAGHHTALRHTEWRFYIQLTGIFLSGGPGGHCPP